MKQNRKAFLYITVDSNLCLFFSPFTTVQGFFQERILSRMANGEIWVCTLRAARNMSYQGLMAKEGDSATLLTLTGQDILGLPLAAPLAHYTTIYTLPMLTIKVVIHFSALHQISLILLLPVYDMFFLLYSTIDITVPSFSEK
jgi:hypothetical protein